MATYRRRKARRSKARRASGRSTRRSTRRSARRSSRSSARSSTRRRRRKSARRRTYGPIRFEHQPAWVRRRGRKSLNRGRSAYRTKRRRASSSRRRTTTRSYSARGSRRASRPLTMAALTKMLRRTKLKAWVCAGRTRTGCGGGKRGRRGSRQMGILR